MQIQKPKVSTPSHYDLGSSFSRGAEQRVSVQCRYRDAHPNSSGDIRHGRICRGGDPVHNQHEGKAVHRFCPVGGNFSATREIASRPPDGRRPILGPAFSMILVQCFQERTGRVKSLNSGTQTHTRGRGDIPDSFAQLLTQNSTKQLREKPTTDFAPSSGAVFPHS